MATDEHEDPIANIFLLKNCIGNSDYISVLTQLKTFSCSISNESIREKITDEHLQLLVELLHTTVESSIVHESKTDENVYQVFTECFRCLRNSCVGHTQNQNYIANKTTALEDANIILTSILDLTKENAFISSTILAAVQFYGNIIVNNTNNQNCIWNKYSDVLKILLKAKISNYKICNSVSMVLYNILLGCPDIEVDSFIELLDSLIDHALQESEFASFAIELLLQKEGFLAKSYQLVSTEQKLILLEMAHSLLDISDDPSLGEGKLSISAVIFLSEQMKSCSDCILKTVGHYADHLEPREVAKLLEIISSASSNGPYMLPLQSDMSLLIDCAFLLKSIHSTGKSGDNNFSSIQKLADLTPAGGNAEVQAHPAFGFKCNLIRLLGNLCWKHRRNQDQVRELDCIPLLLDCCNMDARNPLIIQWVVMAIRNLCEGNKENQNVITAMNRQGTVSSAVLHEMGLTLQDGDDKIRIAPLIR